MSSHISIRHNNQELINRAIYISDEDNWTTEQGVLKYVLRSNGYNDTEISRKQLHKTINKSPAESEVGPVCM